MSGEVHYIFRGDKTFAIRQGKVIAASTDPDEVERQVKQAWMDNGPGDDYSTPERYPIPDEQVDYSPFADEPRNIPNPNDDPCPACRRREGAWDGSECAACGYREHGGHGMENPYPHDEPSPGFEFGGEAGSYMSNVKQAYGDLVPVEEGSPLLHKGPAAPGMGRGVKCPECGGPIDPATGACVGCGMGIRNEEDLDGPLEASPGDGYLDTRSFSRVITPNGLKGTVLGKVAGLWGDEVTVRLENGRIVKLPVDVELTATKKVARARNDIERLDHSLNRNFAQTFDGLHARIPVLKAIQSQVTDLIRKGASYADSLRLDQIAVQAAVEAQECSEALAAMEAAEPMAPPAFTMAAAKEAAGISREDASWLDHTLDEMIKEAEATDFTKLMDEGPEAFAAELPDVALADTGVTRQMASNFIGEKTAAIDRKIAEPYIDTFLTRIEACRRAELATRKQTVHKKAAVEHDKYQDVPDDALFM